MTESSNEAGGNSSGKSSDLMQLACHECGWRPRGDRTMGLVAAHNETEHPEVDGIVMDLVVVCPRCDNVAPLTRDDGKRNIHDCASCHRTYRIPYQSQL